MAPWIENVARDDIPKRFHHDAGFNSMLIQIADPDMDFPEPKHAFLERHFFKFLDIEDKDVGVEQFGITDAQAQQLVQLLQKALDKKMNVVVHCTAGVCRSGAVTEVGVMMGFRDTERFRSPNLRVKHKMMKALGWTYDSEEPTTINGIPFHYDDRNNKVVWEKTESGIYAPPATKRKYPMSTHQELATQARAICSQLRTKSMPLADLIPLIQKMADALDSNERPIGWVSATTNWAGMPRLKIHEHPQEGAKPVWLQLKHASAITPEVKDLAQVVLREMPEQATQDWQLCARAVCNAVMQARD